jgi:hypothetical protein
VFSDTEDQTRGREPNEQGLGSSSSIAPRTDRR